jgi:hypothetical protein
MRMILGQFCGAQFAGFGAAAPGCELAQGA